jgi:S1-C subfamily serine protease
LSSWRFISALVIIIVVGGVAVFYSQLYPEHSTPLKNETSSVIPKSTPNFRDYKLNKSAYQIGQVGSAADSSILTLPQLFAKVEKSVVQITGRIGTSSNLPESGIRLGSGFVYDNNGHIITNKHVADGNQDLDVTFLDGTIYRAKVIGSEPFTDLAVLYVQNVPKDKLAPLPLGNSSMLQVGEQVAAIGNPFGLSGYMSEGIISGLGRRLPAPNPSSTSQYSIPDMIQTDAPINPGNSGGPLLNMKAEVIGINSAIYSKTGEFSGIGFAIPSTTIIRTIPLLITNGSFAHPWLGISGKDMTPEIADAIGLREPRGFLIVDVIPGSPASAAGLRGGNQTIDLQDGQISVGGDVILEIDHKPVRKIDDVLIYLERYKTVGEKIVLTVFRNGESRDIIITLAARPNAGAPP